MLDSDDRTGFSRVETVVREDGERIERTTTIESVHDGFEIHLIEERAVEARKVPDKCIKCVIFSDGVMVCREIPCPKPRPRPEPL